MARHERIPVEDLFRSPTRTAATISPDGTRIAYLAPWRNRLNVWVTGVDSDSDARCVTTDDVRSVLDYQWTGDPRWLLYTQDCGGDENWHVYRVDLDDPTAPADDLTPFPGVRAYVQPLAGRPGKALVGINRRTPELADAYELDVATGEMALLAENPGAVASWFASRGGDLFAMSTTIEGDVVLSAWDDANRTLRTIARYAAADHTLGLWPVEVTPDGKGVWPGSNRDPNRTTLVRLDVETGEETEVDGHPSLSIDPRAAVFPSLPAPLILARRTGNLLGVRYLGARQEIHTLDPRFADVLANLEKLSDGDLAAISSDDAGRQWVVSFTDDREPGLTFYYDHATGTSRQLFRPFPQLNPEALAPMTPVTIRSRDGLDLHSYLMLPVGIEARGLPLVLAVHGGPWSRDDWGFDAGTQLLANRGYAVLQINFRGSTGYGQRFVKAAVGEFAGKMHDDLIDGIDWAVERGYADRDRVAIVGGSYGGYAALVGVTFTPDVFAAAVDYVGISSLPNFTRTLPAIARPHLANNWYLFVGDPADPRQEADMLARSPITRVDQITTPLLVVQGANDSRVVQAESDNLVEALRARGVEVDYIVKHDEGHGFVNPENVIDLWHAIDDFLAKHLGGRPAGAA